VLFRPKVDLSDGDRAELEQAFLDAHREIGSISRARIGHRITVGRPYERLMTVDYTHAAILEFDDLAGLRAYLEHPTHARLAARFFATFETALMYDFELESADAEPVAKS
jgi:acetyl-CoA carboxylase alpha subunit